MMMTLGTVENSIHSSCQKGAVVVAQLAKRLLSTPEV